MSIFKRDKGREISDIELRRDCVSTISRFCGDTEHIIEEADKLFNYIKYGKENKV